MKLGIVSDLHCNIDGLDRALETMGPIDALLCLGDSIYEYRFSNAVIGRLRELDALTILGNHEETFLGAAGVGARSRAEIDRSLLGWLAERPHRRELRSAWFRNPRGGSLAKCGGTANHAACRR